MGYVILTEAFYFATPDQSQFGSPDQQSTRGQRGGFVRGRGRGRGFRETRGGRGTGKSFPGYNQGEG